MIGALPAIVARAPTTHDIPPRPSGLRVHDDDPPRNEVVALPANTTSPDGAAVDVLSLTVALQAVMVPGLTLAGVQDTEVVV